MVYNINSQLEIINKLTNKSLFIDKVIGFNIEDNIENLTTTCTIKLPSKDSIITRENNTNSMLFYEYDLNKRLFVEDKILIKFGYNIVDFESEPIRFYGYISSIKIQDNYIEIYCEDSMYLFKKAKRYQQSYTAPNATLEYIIEDIIDNTEIDINKTTQLNIASFNFTKFRIKDLLSPSEILKSIKDEYGFFVYFRLENDIPILYVGTKIPDNNITYNFNYPYTKNKYTIISKDWNNTSNDYDNTTIIVISTQTTNDTITVYADSTNPNGTTEELIERDNVIEIKIPGLTEIDCIKKASDRLQLVSSLFIEGAFTTFGEPYLRVGDIINLNVFKRNIVSVDLDETTNYDNFKFYIDSIDISYGDGNGIKQQIRIGNSVR